MMRFFARSFSKCSVFEGMKDFFSREFKVDQYTKGLLKDLHSAPTARDFMRRLNSLEGAKLVEKSPELHRLLSEKKSVPPYARLIDVETAIQELNQKAKLASLGKS